MINFLSEKLWAWKLMIAATVKMIQKTKRKQWKVDLKDKIAFKKQFKNENYMKLMAALLY